MSDLYDRIGPELVEQAITVFYERAFRDPIIGHFFFDKDQAHITRQQIDFVTGLLGGPRRYRGKPLPLAHQPFQIRPPHFGRRQVLMREVLEELAIDPEVRDEWLQREEMLRPFVMGR